jgi:hypothetical protein
MARWGGSLSGGEKKDTDDDDDKNTVTATPTAKTVWTVDNIIVKPLRKVVTTPAAIPTVR